MACRNRKLKSVVSAQFGLAVFRGGKCLYVKEPTTRVHCWLSGHLGVFQEKTELTLVFTKGWTRPWISLICQILLGRQVLESHLQLGCICRDKALYRMTNGSSRYPHDPSYGGKVNMKNYVTHKDGSDTLSGGSSHEPARVKDGYEENRDTR